MFKTLQELIQVLRGSSQSLRDCQLIDPKSNSLGLDWAVWALLFDCPELTSQSDRLFEVG